MKNDLIAYTLTCKDIFQVTTLKIAKKNLRLLLLL